MSSRAGVPSCRKPLSVRSNVRHPVPREAVMHRPDSIPELVQRVRAGEARAAEELFARYARQLTRLAEENLSRKVLARVGGEDVVQSVFRTFFRRTAQGEFRIDSSAHAVVFQQRIDDRGRIRGWVACGHPGGFEGRLDVCFQVLG